ncbi:DUF4255 domain-containing protein [Kribbella sp. CA-253562]|uniref:DUF4255 domain-containing protein n=1 Tax=Kribbella sp. CA-253562 TaxID=3239942 RepID=UPI003D8AC04F
MISEADAALIELLRREVLEGAKVAVALDPPTTDWAARRSGPAMNVFLYDIREDLRRRGSGSHAQFDHDGRPVARRLLPRVFRLSYLVTAWTQRPEDEHRLLGAVLRTLLKYEVIPPAVLPDDAPPIGITVGLPPGEDRSFADVWSALGGELRASIDVVLTVPFAAGTVQPIESLVRDPLYVAAELTDGPAGSGAIVASERVGGAHAVQTSTQAIRRQRRSPQR